MTQRAKPGPEGLHDATGALQRLSLLRPNWDSYGAPPIDRAVLKAARDLLRRLMCDETPAPSVVPTPGGGVQLEWHTRGIDIELEFESPVRLRGSFQDQRTGEQWDRDLSFDRRPLSEAIGCLSRS